MISCYQSYKLYPMVNYDFTRESTYISYSGNKFQWEVSDNSGVWYSFNISDETYYYVGIG